MGNKHFEKGGDIMDKESTKFLLDKNRPVTHKLLEELGGEEEELDRFIMENSKDLIKDFVSWKSDQFRAYCKDILDERKAESSQ